MTHTKQTVYLPVEITEEFWEKYDNGEKPDYEVIDADTGERCDEWINKQEGYFFTPEQLNQLLSDVIKDALDTAAEKAECEEGAIVDLGFEKKSASVNKESIINLFKEVYQKLDLL
jgi:hypothetical protein